MSAVRKIDHEIEAAGTALMKLHELAVQFKQAFGFISKIESPEDYEKATAMLHELTSRKLVSRYEENLLDELTQTLLAYEENAEQFAGFNAEWDTPLPPVELLKAFMESAGLTGSDLPEIGDKTIVSKVLNGRRKISAKMAVALAERFHTDASAFLGPQTLDDVIIETR